MDKPNAHDVVFGRGKGAYMHEGNIVFRKLVSTHKVILTHIATIFKPSTNLF